MRLDRLLGDQIRVLELHGDPAALDVSAVVQDTAAIVPGALYCCVPGRRVDGHDLAPAAVAAGAVAVLVERRLALTPDVVQVVVPEVRAAMGPMAAAFFDHPSVALDVVGVTGTNGKTTTTALVRSILEAAGRPTGVIGTLTGLRTTPDGPELQAQLAALRDEGRQAVAMEVSSHALVQHRVDAVRFRVAVFTNLGRDHLDYHETEEAYFQAKARLFDPERSERAVVNIDDTHGRLLAQAARIPTRTVSLADTAEVVLGLGESAWSWLGRRLHLPLGGRHNVANALAAASAALELGVELDAVVAGLASAPPIPGRFEVVARDPIAVVVDYAHSPEALEQLLRAVREVVPAGRVLVVFGAGGDRDQGKRPAMGEVATRLADRVVLTADNPRHEDPGTIAAAVAEGAVDRSSIVVELDRRAAIARAVAEAVPGDVVVVAGKGHEAVQVVGDAEFPFDDRVVVREVLAAAGLASDGPPAQVGGPG